MTQHGRAPRTNNLAMNFVTLHDDASPQSPTDDHGQIRFGIARCEFLENYFEQRWLLRRGAIHGAAFRWSDVDELLYRIDPVAPDLQLFQDGEVSNAEFVDQVQERGVQRRRINKAAFYDRMSRGATLVFNRLEERSLYSKRLCGEISRFVGHPASGNAYLSFGGNGTFGKHWDTHDVFVIQLLGTKRWQVFAPTMPLPLSYQTSAPYRGQAPTFPALDIKLNVGDVLYIPRGWWHHVTPCEVGSLHLSIGVYPPTTIDYLQWLTSRRLTTVEAARAGIGDFDLASLKTEALEAPLIEGMRDPNLLAMYRKSLLDGERPRSEFNLALLLEAGQAELPGQTFVALNNCYAHADTIELVLARSNSQDVQSLQQRELRRVLLEFLATVTVTRLHDVYARVRDAAHSDVCMTLLNLARYDVVTLWRE